MTDAYLQDALDQLERDLAPGHPLLRMVEELIEARRERDEVRQDFRDILGKTDRATMGYYVKYRDWLKEES